MMNSKTVLFAVAFATSLAVSAARAEAEMPESRGPLMGRMADRMKEKLGLNDDQFAKLKTAVKDHEEAMKPLGSKMKDGVKTLAEQVDKKADDAAIKATLAALKADRKALADENEKFHESLAAFLTPVQQAKLVLGMVERMHEMNRGGHGPWAGKDEHAGEGHPKAAPSNDDDGE